MTKTLLSCYVPIDIIHKSKNAPLPYPTINNTFITEMCTFLLCMEHCGIRNRSILGLSNWSICVSWVKRNVDKDVCHFMIIRTIYSWRSNCMSKLMSKVKWTLYKVGSSTETFAPKELLSDDIWKHTHTHIKNTDKIADIFTEYDL